MRTWDGASSSLHVHVKLVLGFGAVLNALPLVLIRLRPAWWGTRHATAVAQMLWSAVLITVTGGRIETHFHIFGSLAFLAFYRDWKVLVTATLVVATEHLARGVIAPEAVYGSMNPEWWRFLEHAAWVVFEVSVLVVGCRHGIAEMRKFADREAKLAQINDVIENRVIERTAQLVVANDRSRQMVTLQRGRSPTGAEARIVGRSCGVAHEITRRCSS